MTEIINKIDIEKKFKCDRCDYTCSITGNLKRHIKQIHDKIKDVNVINAISHVVQMII